MAWIPDLGGVAGSAVTRPSRRTTGDGQAHESISEVTAFQSACWRRGASVLGESTDGSRLSGNRLGSSRTLATAWPVGYPVEAEFVRSSRPRTTGSPRRVDRSLVREFILPESPSHEKND